MGISIKIAGVDRTEFADARSLKIIDELTSRVNSCSFDFICNDIALAPIDGQTVLIEDGATKLFSGRVLSKEENFLPPDLLKYNVECIDYTRDLDKKLVFEYYKNYLAGNIIKHIVDTYLTGFTYNNVADGYIISDISFDYVQVSEAITKIAEICGYEWYIDYDKDIHFFALNTYTAPFDLDDEQADHKDLVINADISQLRNRIYVKSSALQGTFGETFIYDGETEEWTCKFAPINRGREKLSDPDPEPRKGVWRCDFSHDDIYLAVPYEHTVFADKGIIIYKRDNDLFKGLNLPDVTPNDDGHEASFSPDSTYLALVHNNTPYVMIYKRDEDTFTKLTNPNILPTGVGWGCDFSPDGVYLAVAHKNSPYITIYKRNEDTFTKLDNPVNLPTGDGYGCKFSSDGVYLAVAHAGSPYLTIYKRAGDVFTKLTNPAALPAGQGNYVAWTPDSIYLAVGLEVSPFIATYKRAGDVFTKLADPAELPAGAGCGVDFSPDGIQLAVAHKTTPFVTIYTRTGDVLGKQAEPADLPGGDGKGAVFSHNNKYLVIGYFNDPNIIIYKQYLPTIKVDGVIKTIGWDGIDNPLYFDFMLNEQTKVLSIGAAGTQIIDVGTLVSGPTPVGYPNITHINKSNPANLTGKLTRIEIYAYSNLSNCKVATFYRPDPGGFPNKLSTRDTEIIGTVISGSKQIFEVDLDVVAGDYIGVYFTAGYICADQPGYSGRWYINEDKIPCTNQTFEASVTDDTVSIYGTGSLGEGELTIGSEILVGYTTVGIPICFKREDDASIAEVLAIEGGDGIVEFCLVDNNINNIAWADDAAKADLLQNSNPTIEATFMTNRGDIRSGQIITLNSIKRNINQQFIVQKVELIRVDTDAETTIYIYQVTIANKFKKLEDLFIYLLNKSDASLAGGAAAPGGGAAAGAGVSTFLGLTDTPVSYTGEANKFAKVNAGETALEFAIPTIENNVTKTGAFTAGRIAKINNATGIIEQGTNTDTEVADAVTKKHASGSETLAGDVGGTVGANTVNKIKGHIVDEAAIANDKILVYKTTGDKYVYEAKPAVGSTTFLGLTDTPGDYIEHEYEILRVNGAHTAVEFSGVTIETALTVDSNLRVPTSKAVNDFCEITKNYMQDLVDDPSPQLGGDLDLFTHNIYIGAALASDHTYSGFTDSWYVGETVAFGDLLYFDWATKKWKKADADLSANMPGLRIALESQIADLPCYMLIMGYIRDDSWNFTAAMVYASTTAGAMTSTAPTGTGDQVQRVGMAKDPNLLFFDPSIDVGEI